MSKMKFQTAHEVTIPLKEELFKRGNSPELSLKTMPQLNKKLWGLRKKQLTVIGARPSHGKSSFIGQVAYDLASQGHKVLVISLEMSNEEFVERLFCNVRGVKNYDLLTGKFKRHLDEYNRFQIELENMILCYSDCIGKNWSEVDKIFSEMSVKFDVVIVDYIQAIKGTQRTMKENFDDYIINFRMMAKKYNFSAIICSQINRSSQDSKDKRPYLHQLKGTGGLEEQADIVILLYWKYKDDENEETKNDYFLFLAKNRNGMTGTTKIQYVPENYRFVDNDVFIDKKQKDLDVFNDDGEFEE